MNSEIYLDHAASSPLDQSIINFLVSQYEKKMGNPASLHRSGVNASLELEKARIKIAQNLNCAPEEVYFTSGATEANNLALKGISSTKSHSKKNEILISSIEHSSILQLTPNLLENGFVVKMIPVNCNGEINFLDLEKMLSDRTFLVSIVHGNNEIGVIQDLEKIGKLCQKHGVFFHSDGAQAFCKTEVDVKKMYLDLYSISGHKIQAPKGIGALYVRKGVLLSPQIVGGAQEFGLRSGTVPVELITTMAYAMDRYSNDSVEQLSRKYNYLLSELTKNFPSIKIHGGGRKLPNILTCSLPGHDGKYLFKELDKRGVRVSTGSACNSGKKEPSRVLMALNLSENEAYESIRISWSIDTRKEELDFLVKCLHSIVSGEAT